MKARSLVFIFFILSCLSFAACGNNEHGQGAGSASFKLRFEPLPQAALDRLKAKGRQLTLSGDVCVDNGISHITAKAYHSSNPALSLANGGPWLCSNHQGVITNIPSGTVSITVEATEVGGGAIVWRGDTTNISITANSNTAVPNDIIMTYVDPAHTVPPEIIYAWPTGSSVAITNPAIVTFNEFVLPSSLDTTTFTLRKTSGTTVAGFVSYDAATKQATFTPSSSLTASTSYTATVASVKDLAGNVMMSPYTWSFTTAAPAVTLPAAPTGVIAAAGNQQNTITWNAVSGVTSYSIYYGTTPGVTKTNGTLISGIAGFTQYTHTGLTNGTTYYYVVTASLAGESAISAEVSATPYDPLPPPLP